MAIKQDCFAESAQSQVAVNGHVIRLSKPHHKAEVRSIAALIDRKIAEDKWHPFAAKEARAAYEVALLAQLIPK